MADFSPSQIEDMRHSLETQAGALDAALALLDVAIRHSRDELGEIAELYRSMGDAVVRHNLDIIYRYSESPIESLFWASLAMGFLIVDPLGARFLPPTPNAPDHIRAFREDLAAKRRWLDAFAASSQPDIARWMKELAAKYPNRALPPAEDLRQHQFETQLDVHSGWNFSLQAGFPALQVVGRSLRVDMLAWIGASSSPGIVVECDGFQFHSDKNSFVRDRRRDRLLSEEGLRVVRFAGPEVYRHPCAAAVELFEILRKARSELLGDAA